MKVTLLTHTPDPEKLIASAAKLCYSSSDVATLMDNLTDEKIKEFIDMLNAIGHESPMEHASFTFAVEGISRACSHQLVRHRIASYSQKSQRYVDENDFEYVTPPSVLADDRTKEQYDIQMKHIANAYVRLRNALVDYHKNTLIADGHSEKSALSAAKKLANEDARFLLPNACETKIVVTMNVRSLFNFFKHRCCNRAQWEIRAVACEMLRLCCEVAPNIFKHAGPDCYTKGRCSEGKMSCGKPCKPMK